MHRCAALVKESAHSTRQSTPSHPDKHRPPLHFNGCRVSPNALILGYVWVCTPGKCSGGVSRVNGLRTGEHLGRTAPPCKSAMADVHILLHVLATGLQKAATSHVHSLKQTHTTSFDASPMPPGES